MNETEYKQLKRKILDVNALVAKLDPTIRAEVFALLKSYLLEADDSGGHTKRKEKKNPEQAHEGASSENVAALIAAHPNGTPAKNVVLIAAHLYSQYGTATFTTAEIQQLGDSFGLTVPNRIDNTLKTAKRSGKKLFQKVGKEFKPTVNGETVFRTDYNVTKGRKPRPTEAED